MVSNGNFIQYSVALHPKISATLYRFSDERFSDSIFRVFTYMPASKATQRKYLVSCSYERTKLTRTHAFLSLFLKVKGHIIVSHARRLGTSGSILNLRCFPNSKTADSFWESVDFPTEQTMGWPTSSDGRMRGTPERTEPLTTDW